jgi:hypothetical protein
MLPRLKILGQSTELIGEMSRLRSQKHVPVINSRVRSPRSVMKK